MGTKGKLIIVGGILFLIAAFMQHVMWGIGCLFCAPVNIVFLILHWQVAKRPFLIQIAGFVIALIGLLLGGDVLLAG